jgi:hypothetical protein
MQQYASRWQEAIGRCWPDASEDHVAAATQAAIGLIHSVTYWPPKVLKADDLGDFLVRLVRDGLSTLTHERLRTSAV